MSIESFEPLFKKARDNEYSAIVVGIGTAGFNAQGQQCPNFIREIGAAEDNKKVLMINIDPKLSLKDIESFSTQYPHIEFVSSLDWFSEEGELYESLLKEIPKHLASSEIPIIISDYVDRSLPPIFKALANTCTDDIEQGHLTLLKGYAAQHPVFTLDASYIKNPNNYREEDMMHVSTIMYAHYFARDPVGRLIKPEDFENVLLECKAQYEAENDIKVTMPEVYQQRISDLSANDVHIKMSLETSAKPRK